MYFTRCSRSAGRTGWDSSIGTIELISTVALMSWSRSTSQ